MPKGQKMTSEPLRVGVYLSYVWKFCKSAFNNQRNLKIENLHFFYPFSSKFISSSLFLIYKIYICIISILNAENSKQFTKQAN